jgi:hypothetical protein
MKFLDVPQSGSFAGNTHSHNRAGQYRRNRRSPVQPVGTGRRAFIRSAFGAASIAWSAMTSAEQAAWATYADSHPYVDSLGASFKLTGHQMYVAIQTNRQNVGLAVSTAIPVSDAQSPISGVTLTVTAGTPALSIAWAGGTGDNYLLFGFAPPQSSGRNYVSNYWQAAYTMDDGSPEAPLAAFVAQFGALAVGQRIFCKVTPVNQYGVRGVPIIVSKQIAT